MLAQNDLCRKVELICSIVKESHVAPKAIDESFSAEVFASFFRTIDPNSRLLLATDEVEHKQYERNLFEKGSSSSCALVEQVAVRYALRINEVLSYLSNEETVLFDPTEVVDFAPLSTNGLCPSKECVKEKWELAVKWRVR